MGKSHKWLHTFLSNWEECKDRKITGGPYAANLTELYRLCEQDMGKSWAKRVYRVALKRWERKEC